MSDSTGGSCNDIDLQSFQSRSLIALSYGVDGASEDSGQTLHDVAGPGVAAALQTGQGVPGKQEKLYLSMHV